MSDWQPIETAPKDMRRVPGGGRSIEIYAEWAMTSSEWSIAEWDHERGCWVHHDTGVPLIYANDEGWAKKAVLWRPLRDPPTKNELDVADSFAVNREMHGDDCGNDLRSLITQMDEIKKAILVILSGGDIGYRAGLLRMAMDQRFGLIATQAEVMQALNELKEATLIRHRKGRHGGWWYGLKEPQSR